MNKEAFLDGYINKKPFGFGNSGPLPPLVPNATVGDFISGAQAASSPWKTVKEIGGALSHWGGKPAAYANLKDSSAPPSYDNIKDLSVTPGSLYQGRSFLDIARTAMNPAAPYTQFRKDVEKRVREESAKGAHEAMMGQVKKWLPAVGMGALALGGMGMYNMHKTNQLQKQMQMLMMQRAMQQRMGAAQPYAYRM